MRQATSVLLVFTVLSTAFVASALAQTATPTDISIPTPTFTNTPIDTPTPTDTPALTPTDTPTLISTDTPTPTDTPTTAPTNTATATDTPTDTPTPTLTPGQSATITPTDTPAPTGTLTPTDTETPTQSSTTAPTDTPTNTPSNTATATGTPTNTPTPRETPTPSCAPTGTPYCSATCVPCPTIRSGCYASACGACGQNPVCGTGAACVSPSPGSGNYGVCCSCATYTPTPTSTATATPTPTATATDTPTPACAGDCNGDGHVTVDEILTMVNIALGNTPISACEAGDANHDGQITVDEILTAVNNALEGCPSTPTYSVSGTISYYTSGVPVPGAVVELQGTTTLVTQADANGQFVFDAVPPGAWRIQPSKMGDFRGSIDVRDGDDMLQAADGVLTLTPEQRLACDVTGDGVVDQADVSSLLDYIVGNLTRFPAADRCASDWIFVPAPDTAPYQSVTPPLVTAESCQPGSIEFTPLSASATGQGFQAVLIGDCNLSWPN